MADPRTLEIIMNLPQLQQSLHDLFFAKECRVVFWYDPEKSFDAEVDSLTLDGVTVWRLDRHGPLATKLEVERNRPEDKFLLYAPFARPQPREDWLLDIYLYAKPFSADRSAILLNTLGLQDPALTEHLARRMDFFTAQARLEKFTRLVQPNDDETAIDVKILTVLSHAEFARIEAVTLALFSGFESVFGEVGFELENAHWEDVRKFGLEDAFWRMVREHWGYASETPRLKDLFLHLAVTHFHQHVMQQPGSAFPDCLVRFVLPSGATALNASVFISHWMQNARLAPLFVQLAEIAETELNLETVVSGLDPLLLGTADTFEALEKQVVVSCRERILSKATSELDRADAVIQARRDRFWCANVTKSYAHLYAALSAASRMFRMKATWGDGFHYASPDLMFAAYAETLYAFDLAYRQFHTAAGMVKQGLDVLKGDLVRAVENLYCNGFVQPLALEWGRHVEARMIDHWKVAGYGSQLSFYRDYVQPVLDERDTSRAYVIISDALRYEVARQFSDQISQGDRISARTDCVLGVLPSSTAFGMAALLPHNDLRLDAELQPLIDGVAATPANRERILKAAEPRSLVVKADELLAMTTQAGRDVVKGMRVVYIYHNRIDAIGDKRATEESTFEATERTIEELSRLVGYIHGCLNGSRIFVTSDHGFLFQTGEMDGTDKNAWTPGGQVRESKKRYVTGRDLPEQAQAWKFKASAIFGGDCEGEIVIPKGAQRFHFAGGARFVHGGALLQEIAIPVVTLKGLKGQQAKEGRARKVDVQLLDKTNMKVFNNRQRFSFLQENKVEGKVLPRTLRIAFRTQSGEVVSDEQVLTFDSKSERLADRQKDVLITLKGGKYDKQQSYFLVLTDDESGAEYKKLPFRISLGIGNEFGEW